MEGRYASINESVIGSTALCGLGIGMTASRQASDTPFYLCTILVLIVAVVVLVVFIRKSRRKANPAKDLAR